MSIPQTDYIVAAFNAWLFNAKPYTFYLYICSRFNINQTAAQNLNGACWQAGEVQ